ncbi:hypothetical protein IWZ01DRAFT_318410 [Phyllosticta capitalensis]
MARVHRKPLPLVMLLPRGQSVSQPGAVCSVGKVDWMERICPPLPVRPTTPHSFMSIISPVPVPVPVPPSFSFPSPSFFSAIAGLLFSFFTPPRAMPCDSCCPALARGRPSPSSHSSPSLPLAPIRLPPLCHAPLCLSSLRGATRGVARLC